MGKKRRDGRAAPKRGHSASFNAQNSSQQTTTAAVGIRYENGVYYGELRGGKPHGNGRLEFGGGEFYDGEWKDGLHHGIGIFTHATGDVYDGEWKDGMELRGTFTWADGDVYRGEFLDGEPHGRGEYLWAGGKLYEGQFVDAQQHGRGTMTLPSIGEVYEGEWVAGKEQGRGTYKWADGRVYEGQFVGGDMHGRGTMTYPSGDVYEGEWVAGKKHGKGTRKYSSGDICEQIWSEGELANGDATNQCPPGNVAGESALPNADSGYCDTTRNASRKPFEGRKLRSQRSQKNRLETVKQTCEHCGVDDYHYKLRMCSGCNLALYCSAACQKASSRSHRRICDILSMLPSSDSDRLLLKYDKDKMVDLDAGLRYATKYMDSLKHLTINLKMMAKDDAVKLSAKQLSSLFRSKKGALDSVFWDVLQYGHVCHHLNDICESGAAWNELCGLKQLRLQAVKCDNVQPICDIIGQQKNALLVLSLPMMDISWHKAKTRRAMAVAISSCKELVKLDMQGCVFMDSDLKIMLQDLPNLRILRLAKPIDGSHDFTDNTCALIARKCPGLQELNLFNHHQLSVRGIRKILEGCIHLRSFGTSSLKLRSNDVQSLLDIAPHMLYLALVGSELSAGELDKLIEATGGRVVFQLRAGGMLLPGSVSIKAREKYECQIEIVDDVWNRQVDPKVANEWEILLEG